MTHRTHALRPGSQWRRAPSAPVSLRPRTVLLVAGGIALAAALVVAVGVGTQFLLWTTKVPGDFTGSFYAPLAKGGDSPLADLAWLAGTWREEREGGEVLEERWDPPLGDSMTGTMRWLKDGKASMYEFLLLEAREEGVRLHIRHFHPGSVAWEGKDEPVSLTLAERYRRELVFTSEVDFPSRFTMRLDDEGVLHSVLEGLQGLEETRLTFTYRRVGP
jgi:hypothetical protein